MPTVTALQPEHRDRVRVGLDGAHWRTLPAAAVVAAGLRLGAVLDREQLRTLRRAIRRSEALDSAGRALARRDRSVAALGELLEHRGIAEKDSAEAVDTLVRLGYLDDDRYAISRAGALAARGYGDEAIRFELGRDGIDAERIASALGSCAPEVERARELVGANSAPTKTAMRLARRGFSPEAIEAAVGLPDLD